MEANKILQADVLDLIFEGRNKAYGAYDLRKTYNRRIRIALIVTFGAVLAIFAASFLAKTLAPTEKAKVEDLGVTEETEGDQETKAEVAMVVSGLTLLLKIMNLLKA